MRFKAPFSLIYLTLWFAVFASAGAAEAAPVVGAIAAIGKAIAGFAASSWIGGVIVKIGTSIAVGMLNKVLGKVFGKKPEAVGVVLETQMGEDLPLSFVVGRRATAGKLKYWGTWGTAGKTPNAHYVCVYEIGAVSNRAGGQGLSGVWLGDTEATPEWDKPHADGRGAPVKEFRRKGLDYCYIKYLDGTQTTADPYLRAKFGSHPDRPWTAEMIGRDKQLVILTCIYQPQLFSGGAPQFLGEPAPLKMYDLRKDSSVGGNGPHRWADASTWEPTLNPAVIIYNIVRGLRNSKGGWLYGGQNVAAYRLPASAWMAAANECDRVIDGRPQFRAGAEISVDGEPLGVIEELLLACNGRFILSGATCKLLVGAPAAPVRHITDAMIIRSAEEELDPWPSLSQTHNTIVSSYPDPAARWAMKTAPEYSVSQYVDADARWLSHAVPFKAVPWSEQVQALQKTLIEDGRRFLVHEFTLPPWARLLEPGDVIAWTSGRNTYASKAFEVQRITRGRGSLQRVIIKEIDPSDFDPPEIIIPPVNGWIGPITVPTQQVTEWTAEPDYVRDDQGRLRRPAIRVTTPDGMVDIARVWIQVRLAGAADPQHDSDAYVYDAPFSWLISGDWMLPDTDYEVRLKYVPMPGVTRDIEWPNWKPVRTHDVRLSLDDLSADARAAFADLQKLLDDGLPEQIRQVAVDLAAEAEARVAAIQQQADALAAEAGARVDNVLALAHQYRALIGDMSAIKMYVANSALISLDQTEQLRTSLVATINDTSASFDARITAAASTTQAVVERTTALESKTATTSALLVEIEQASVSRDTALSMQLTGLQAGTANQFDHALAWRFDDVGALEGWTGNPAPTVSGGCIRPGDGAAPTLISPSGLAVKAAAYPQVRLRVKRTGTPVWSGYCWWRRTVDAGWDTARRAQAAEPVWEPDGAGYATINLPWDGTIDQIRLDIPASQSPADNIAVDWVMIGAPAPGASRAELAAERQARATGDAALAQSIAVMQATMEDATGDIGALATGVEAMSTTVTQHGERLDAQSQALQAVEADMPGKASTQALDLLRAEVSEITGGAAGGGGIYAAGEAVRALRNAILNLAGVVTDRGLSAMMAQQDIRDALASVSQTMTTRIEEANNQLILVAESVTDTRVQLGTKAEGSAVQALTSRMTVAEDRLTITSGLVALVQGQLEDKAETSALQAAQQKIDQQGDTLTAQGNLINSASAGLPSKASVAAHNSLAGIVTQQGERLDVQGGQINSVSASLAGKANSGDVNTALSKKTDVTVHNALAALVTQQGNAQTAQGSQINAINIALGGKADAANVNTELDKRATVTALNALSGVVTQQGSQISATSDWLSQVSASVGGITADGRLRMSATAGAGGDVTFGWMGRTSAGAALKEGGFWITVPSGSGEPTMYVKAARFLLLDNGKTVFGVANGQTYLEDVNIERARVGNLQVDRHNIKIGAVNRIDYNVQGGLTIPRGGIHTVIGQTAYHETGSPAILVDASFSVVAPTYNPALSGVPPSSAAGLFIAK